MSRESERKRIRHKVIEILKKAQIPGVGESVFSRRSTNSDDQELPLINVYANNEVITRNDESPKVYQRNFSIELEIQSMHDTDDELSDELDELSQHVENALEGTSDLYDMEDKIEKCPLINDYDLASVIYETEGNGVSPMGSCRMVYNFEYYTNEDRPGTLKDFKSMESEFQANGNQDSNAKDVAIFEQEQV